MLFSILSIRLTNDLCLRPRFETATALALLPNVLFVLTASLCVDCII